MVFRVEGREGDWRLIIHHLTCFWQQGRAWTVAIYPSHPPIHQRHTCHAAHFYAKMPCLRCGCPWWLGDDWDASCVRCGWDCEGGGYDDDSRPLPEHRERWQRFVRCVAEGKTAHWTAPEGHTFD